MRAMRFDHSSKVIELQRRLDAFMHEHVYPNEPNFHRQIADGDRWQPVPIVEALKIKARTAHVYTKCSVEGVLVSEAQMKFMIVENEE